MKNLRKAIRKAGKKQIDVAKILDIRPDSFSTAISRKTLTVEQLEKIANFLNVEMFQLFADNEKQNFCPHCKKPIKLTIEKM